MDRKPRVSVVLPCYNHEKFIADAVDSVLGQTYRDFELIVTDNGSTDNSGKILKSYGDQIHLITLEKNDPMKSMELLWGAAQGEFVAVLCSDDSWYPQKLEKQMEAVEAHPECGIFFTMAEITHHTLDNVQDRETFGHGNRSRQEWVREMVFYGTPLELSSLLIKNDGRYQEHYKDVSRFRQLPDLKLYYNMVMKEDIYVVEEYLVKHRLHGTNMSSTNGNSMVRTMNEQAYIMHDIWEKMEPEFFKKGFYQDLRYKDASGPVEIMCEKIHLILLIGKNVNVYGSCALEFFWDHFYDEGVEEVLKNKYQITLETFFQLSGIMGNGHDMVEKTVKSYNAELTNVIKSIADCNDRIIENLNNERMRPELFDAMGVSLEAITELEKQLKEYKVNVGFNRVSQCKEAYNKMKTQGITEAIWITAVENISMINQELKEYLQ